MPMHARVTIATGAPTRAKEDRESLEATVPKVREVPGLRGAIYLQDAASGKIVVVTLFGSKEEIEASREAANKIRENAVSEMGATIESVDEFEIVGEAGPGMAGASHGRMTSIDGPPERADEARRLITEMVIPAAERIAGLKRGYWMGDDVTGRFAGVVLFGSEEELVASRETAQRLRDASTEQLGATVRSVEEYEVVATI